MKPQRVGASKTPKRVAAHQQHRTPAAKTPKVTAFLNSSTADPVDVFCRLRPTQFPHSEVCLKVVDNTQIELIPPELSHAARNGNVKQQTYRFKYVFDDQTTQQGLFDHVTFPLVKDLIKGKNGLLFTYGVTGSGKTHTMTGSSTDPGVMPRCIDVLFNSIGDRLAPKYMFYPNRHNSMDFQSEADAMLERQRREILSSHAGTKQQKLSNSRDFSDKNRAKDTNRLSSEEVDDKHVFTVFISYNQIYNTFIYDLLEDTPRHGNVLSKVLREDTNGVMFVQGAVEVEVSSPEEAFEIFNIGNSRRKTACTSLNEDSSRSHSVFTIRVVQVPLDASQEIIQDKSLMHVSQLSLVDLAGSERTKRTGNTGMRVKEASNINNSLMTLRSCIEALRDNQQQLSQNPKQIPYRESKLTHLFKNYFEGDGKVKMIVCINPLANEYDETSQVVKFAELTADVLVQRGQQVRFVIPKTEPALRVRAKVGVGLHEAGAIPFDAGLDVTDILKEQFPPIYSLPSLDGMRLEIQGFDDDITLPNLMRFITDRGNKVRSMHGDITSEVTAFRKRLVGLDTNMDKTRKERDTALHEVREERRQTGYLTDKCTKLEQEINLFRNMASSEQYVLGRQERQLKERDNKLMLSEGKLKEITNVLHGGSITNTPVVAAQADPVTTLAGSTPYRYHPSTPLAANPSPMTPSSVKVRAQQWEDQIKDGPSNSNKRLSQDDGDDVETGTKKRRS